MQTLQCLADAYDNLSPRYPMPMTVLSLHVIPWCTNDDRKCDLLLWRARVTRQCATMLPSYPVLTCIVMALVLAYLVEVSLLPVVTLSSVVTVIHTLHTLCENCWIGIERSMNLPGSPLSVTAFCA